MTRKKAKTGTRMPRVYVAGPIDGPDVGTVMRNIRFGVATAASLLARHNLSPFCPHLDWQWAMHEDITHEQFKAYSMEWVSAADAVLVLPGSDNCRGVQAEIRRAVEIGIPVFHSVAGLLAWRDRVRIYTHTFRRRK